MLVTCGSLREARKISRAVVEKKLAACVNIGSPVESIYHWKGKIETAKECLLVIKTNARRLEELQREVLRLHSYDTPEFLVMDVTAGSPAYLNWLGQSVA